MASILIIDDDVTVLSRLGDQLADAGHQVERSSDLAHARELHDAQRPDLVILEVRSGGEAGWELLPSLAADTAVLVLSSAGLEEDVVRGFSNGAIDYVTKPYRSEELLARLRVRLAGSHAPRPAPAHAPTAEPAQAPRVNTPKLLTVPPPPRRRGRRDDPADESVFMSEAEEMALLRMPPAAPAGNASSPETGNASVDGSLGSRLRAERLRRHLTLVQVENELKVRMSYLQAMEDEKFTLLPRGPVAIQMLSGYAGFLGLDAAALTNEFRDQHYVDPIEPPPALGGSAAARSLPRWLVMLVAIVLALALAAGAIYALDPAFFQNLPTYAQALWRQLLGLFGARG